jgi:hypothetical protein
MKLPVSRNASGVFLTEKQLSNWAFIFPRTTPFFLLPLNSNLKYQSVKPKNSFHAFIHGQSAPSDTQRNLRAIFIIFEQIYALLRSGRLW